VQRLLPALLFALCCHGLLVLLPYSEKSTIPPRLPGEKTIRISLSGNAAPEPQSNSPAIEKKENKKQPEPVPETRPVLQQQQNIVPVALQAQSIKKKIHTKTRPVKPSHKTSPRAVSHKTEEAAAPVTVTAIPLYNKNPKPKYPALARRRNWQGTVTLSVTVSEQGSVDRITLHRSSGHALLDKTALKTVKTWHFLPGRENGHATVMEVLVPVHFKLK